MSAKQKLNDCYAIGAFIVSIILGLVTGSVAVFAATFVLLVALCLANGDIRR